MTLKYTFEDRPNPAYNEKEINKHTKIELKLSKAKEDISYAEAEESDHLSVVKKTIDKNLTQVRETLKELNSQPKILKEVHIKSQKSWTLFPEHIGDECGRTRYGPKEEYKVDVKIPYKKEADDNTKAAIKKAQDSALSALKDYRRKRKEIASIEKTFIIEGLPAHPKYTVYAANGYGGQARMNTYRDVWRGTHLEVLIPEGKDNFCIHMKGGTFVELQEAAKCRVVFEPKKPKTDANHVGIEIEYVSKFDKFQTAKNLCDEGVQEFVCLVNDGSIRTEGDAFKHAHELTLVAPEAIIHEVLVRVLRALNKDGGSKVGGRCGLHVHLDMRGRDKKKAFHNLSKAQNILYAMNSSNRTTGKNEEGENDTNYCKRIEATDFDAAIDYLGGQRDARYHGINLLALDKHMTIEVRIHSGSTNFEKISKWVKILTSIVNLQERVVDTPTTVETFCAGYKLDADMQGYINKRIALFKDNKGRHITLKESA
jgi:hypothetical protein